MNYRQPIQRRYINQNSNARFYEKPAPDIMLKEAIREIQYSRKTFAVDKAQTIPFFRDHTGSSLIDTNTAFNGQMSSTESFLLEGISVRLQLGMSKADILKFYNYSTLSLKLSDKTYLKACMLDIPSGGGIKGMAVMDGNSSAEEFFELSNCEPHPMMFFPVVRTGNDGMPTPVKINPNQKFEIEIQTFAPSDFSATFFAVAKMHGERIRE